jgi:serine/threonine protein kinase
MITMKYVCTHCERVSPDGNLWCVEQVCLAEAKPLVFDTGDDIGDIEIVRRLGITRTAAFYEAKRGEDRLIVKVAHNAPAAQEKLKHEAKVFLMLAAKKQHPNLPVLVSPYKLANVGERPYGKVAFGNETKYYLVFEYVPGEFLADQLKSQAQPWYNHAAWTTMQLADAVAFMHDNGFLHLNLNPSGVFIRTDRDGYPRPLLFDLGFPPELSAYAESISGVGYTAPDLLRPSAQAVRATDVYGLASLFYETLAGQAAYPSKARTVENVRKDVLAGTAPKLKRTDLPVPTKPEHRDTMQFLADAMSPRTENRQQDIPTFAHEIRRLYGDAPAERKPRRWTRRTTIIAIALGTLVMILLQLLSAFLA